MPVGVTYTSAKIQTSICLLSLAGAVSGWIDHMAGARKTFRPPLWGIAGLILSGGLCIGAGIWQLDRAEQKQKIFDSFESGSGAPARTKLVSNDTADEAIYQRFLVDGRYDGEHQILIDNMTFNGRNGYQVLTPLRTGGEAILVNRGWVPANPDRSILPDLAVDNETRPIAGRLRRLPRPGIRLDAPETSADAAWPRRLLFPQATEIITQIGYVVYDYQLLLDPTLPDGFVREWSPKLMSPEKHVAYAVQWFLLALTLAVIFFIVNWKVPGTVSPND